MNHREQLTREDILKAKLIMDSVTNLDDADCETLEDIIELLGMREQMLRQLVMGAALVEVETLIEEKKSNQGGQPSPH